MKTDATNDVGHVHESASPGLSLNNGQMWKADNATSENVSAMLVIIEKFDQQNNKEPDNYKTLGNDLQAALDKMIKERKMKGPDHEALHHWLEPLMKSVTGLKKSTGVEKSKKIAYDISTRVKFYSQYFDDHAYQCTYKDWEYIKRESRCAGGYYKHQP